MRKIIGMVVVLVLLSIAFVMTAQATNDNTTIVVYVETDGNVNASFGATAGGNVSYWIDGIEVEGEFESIWDAINYFDSELSDTKETAHYAFFMANSNSYKIQKNEEELEEHNQTLMIHYDTLNETITNLLILRDEVVAFEEHYFGFVNETNTTLNTYGENINLHGGDIATLKVKVTELNGLIVLIMASLLGFVLLAGTLQPINGRYPFARSIKNDNVFLRNDYKQCKLGDFTQKTKSAKKSKTNSNAVRVSKSKILYISKIRINSEKSPLKTLFSFLFLMNKGGKKE